MSYSRAAIAAVSLLFLGVGAAVAQPTYTVTDLGIFPGGTVSKALGINELGQVVGEADKPGSVYTHAVLWTGGQMIDVTGIGLSGARGYAVSDAGMVIGTSDAIDLNAFTWQDGVFTPLPVPLACCSEAQDMTAGGLIVGQASPQSIGIFHAVTWQVGVMTDLGTLGGAASAAYGVNESGQITGDASTPAGFNHAFLLDSGQMNDLGTLGGNGSTGRDINESGHVVGYSDLAGGGSAAFIWRGGQLINLGRLPGGFYSYAYGVNDLDHVAGSSYGDGPGGLHAVIWVDDQPINLNDLIDPTSGWHLAEATDINNAGQIVGHGSKDGQTHALLLTPTAAIPTVSQWGAVVMVLMVATCGTLAFGLRRMQALRLG